MCTRCTEVKASFRSSVEWVNFDKELTVSRRKDSSSRVPISGEFGIISDPASLMFGDPFTGVRVIHFCEFPNRFFLSRLTFTNGHFADLIEKFMSKSR